MFLVIGEKVRRESLGKLIGAVMLGIIIENCRDQSAIALLKSLGIVNFQTTDLTLVIIELLELLGNEMGFDPLNLL